MKKKFKIGLFGINSDSGLSLTTAKEKWSAKVDELTKLIKYCDNNIDFILPLSKWKGWDGESDPNSLSYETLTFSSYFGALTKKLYFFSTVHVPFIHPVFVARAIATNHKLTNGRVGLNVVCGWNQSEFKMFRNNDKVYSDDSRYKYGSEWLKIFNKITNPKIKKFSFKSDFFDIKNAQCNPKILKNQFKLMSAAYSESGRKFALKNCDYLFTMFHDLKKTKIRNSQILEESNKNNKKIELFAPIHIICRKSKSEANEFHDYYSRKKQDKKATENFIVNVAKANKGPLYKIMKNKSDIIASSCGSSIIKGDPNSVAEQLREVQNAKFSGAAFSFVNYLDEIKFFNEKVLSKKIFN
jgi:dimethylsulfone monooxygenase